MERIQKDLQNIFETELTSMSNVNDKMTALGYDVQQSGSIKGSNNYLIWINHDNKAYRFELIMANRTVIETDCYDITPVKEVIHHGDNLLLKAIYPDNTIMYFNGNNTYTKNYRIALLLKKTGASFYICNGEITYTLALKLLKGASK